MNEKSAEFLSEYLEMPAPTGLEMDAQRLWAEYIRPYTDEVQCDAYGSTWALLRAAGENAPTLMLDAHADEIGFSIRYITRDLHADGFTPNYISEHEQKFTSMGMPIHMLIAVKEDVEIAPPRIR